VAVLDRGGAGKTSGELLGVGGAIPVVASLADAPAASTLLLGIAPPGGKIPAHWRQIVLQALQRGMTVVSGLHEFLADDPEFAPAAARHGAALIDLRRNDEHDVAHRRGIRAACLRIHTVANDCSSGKMVVAVEVAQGLQQAGVDAAFVATGQTGILVAGGGCPIDRVIADFVAGAAEKLVLANQHHEVIVVEGQGSLFHPRYSGVTLSLLHGTMPHGLIACYEMGRKVVFGMPEVTLPPLRKVVDFYETAANLMHPCRVIGIAVNGIKFSAAEVQAECARVEDEFQLPACDVLRHGPEKLVAAVRRMKE
jgi:uncharacterized NAD-dependent epimerase/dehydratase family protein